MTGIFINENIKLWQNLIMMLPTCGNLEKSQNGAKKLGNKFFDYYGKVFEEGALTALVKNLLIALAVAHTEQCPYCIDAYTKDGLTTRGITKEQMMEAIHVGSCYQKWCYSSTRSSNDEQSEQIRNVREKTIPYKNGYKITFSKKQ